MPGLMGVNTDPLNVKSSLEREREPARRFVRVQNLDFVPDSVLEPDEYQMRCLLAHEQYSKYPACTENRVIRVYDLHLYTTLRETILALYVAGNVHAEVSAKTGISTNDLDLFCYFFCSEEFLALPKPAKTAVLTNPSSFHKACSHVLLSLNMDKIGVDIHFNLIPDDVKKHSLRMREVVIANQFYLATKDVHFVKPGQKAFAAVQDAMERSNSSLKDISGGDKSGTIEEVMKRIEKIQATVTIVPAKDPEDLNLPSMEDLEKENRQQNEGQDTGGVA